MSRPTPLMDVGSKEGCLTLVSVVRRAGGPFGIFRCDCGNVKEIRMRSVWPRKITKSCGCQRVAMIKKNSAQLKHGLSTRSLRIPEHSIWTAMKQRCRNRNCKAYKWYGARGISVDCRWDSFENFIANMGRRPGPEHSIDRINNDGNYEPGNCRWATRAQQSKNKRQRTRRAI